MYNVQLKRNPTFSRSFLDLPRVQPLKALANKSCLFNLVRRLNDRLPRLKSKGKIIARSFSLTYVYALREKEAWSISLFITVYAYMCSVFTHHRRRPLCVTKEHTSLVNQKYTQVKVVQSFARIRKSYHRALTYLFFLSFFIFLSLVGNDTFSERTRSVNPIVLLNLP